MITVFLVDDHEIVRRGVADLLTESGDVSVIGEAASKAEALVRVPSCAPDVVVLDVRLPDGSGVELCRELRSVNPDLRCLMLTSFSDDEALLDSIIAGAKGFVLKQILGSDLVSAVTTVAAGKSLLDERATGALMRRLQRQAATSPDAALTPQERVVLELIGEGLTNRQIGERMFLAEKTIKNHVTRLLAKLGVQRRTQAAVIAADMRRDSSRTDSPVGTSQAGPTISTAYHHRTG